MAQKLFDDRPRTNFLKKHEQAAITSLLGRVPAKITPDAMTGVGLAGSLIVLTAFVLSKYVHQGYLLLAIAGLAINWLGDSLDGRLAYYRGIPRKWYGFSLDIIMDWLSTVFIGLGGMLYVGGWGSLFAFSIVVMYGWSMIIALLRFKVADRYQIDSGLMGPTEFRLILAAILILEFFSPGLLSYFVAAIAITLFAVNFIESKKLLTTADFKDKRDKKIRQTENSGPFSKPRE